MKVQVHLTRYIMTGMIAVLAVVIIVAATGRGHLGRGQRTPLTTGQQEEQRVESVMPPVISSVKDIEVLGAYVDEERQANITIRNNSNKGIQGFAVSSGSFTLIEDNGLKTDNPEVIIAPHANYLIQLPASNLRASLPVIISGALYNDYTEDGDAAVRKNMREAREREKGKRLLSKNERPEDRVVRTLKYLGRRAAIATLSASLALALSVDVLGGCGSSASATLRQADNPGDCFAKPGSYPTCQ